MHRQPEPYPANLRLQVRRAARLSHALARLVDETDPGDASFVWLVGRADEVRAVVGTAMREWQEGRVSQRVASERISSYVRDLEESVRCFFLPRGRLPSRVEARAPPRSDTLIDAGATSRAAGNT
ncbi:MAG: hypothetical protein ACRELB_05350 [Polyangiaceae bacterium]